MAIARIGIINRTINMLDFLLAEHAGIYAANGLEPQFDTLAGKESIESLLAGDLDFVVSVGAATRAIMTEDAPVRVALLVHRNAPHWLMASPSVSSVADLRGRKVQAAQPGSEPDVMVQKYLSENGLNPSTDVELIYQRAHPGWKENGPRPEEDAVIARTLEQEVLEAMDYQTLVELCEHYPNTLIHGLVATEKTITADPGLLKAMIESHRTVAAWIDEGKDEVIDFIAANFTVSEDRARRAVSSLNGKFVARLEPSDFNRVIESSATALGQQPIDVNRLVARV